MLIRFNNTVSDGQTTYKPGEVHDLPNQQANGYVQDGRANKIAENGSGTKPTAPAKPQPEAPTSPAAPAADPLDGITAPAAPKKSAK